MPRPHALLWLLLVLALPANAAAAGCKAPQGTSAVDQYCEVIPGSKGDSAPGQPGSGGGAGSNGSISDRSAAALAAQGKDGQALARSLGKDPASASVRAASGSKRVKQAPDTTTGAPVPKVPASNPFTAATRAVTGTSTVGGSFFLVFFAVVLLVLGSAWVGWRRGSS